ncbi:hypothetical protein [Burkholderia multivorans]|nr:hypothetical protein [Burkholderia multivorans]
MSAAAPIGREWLTGSAAPNMTRRDNSDVVGNINEEIWHVKVI